MSTCLNRLVMKPHCYSAILLNSLVMDETELKHETAFRVVNEKSGRGWGVFDPGGSFNWAKWRMGAVYSWREKIRVSRGMIEVGAVISGHTTHGSFVSPGLSSPATLSTLLPLGSAWMLLLSVLTFS